MTADAVKPAFSSKYFNSQASMGTVGRFSDWIIERFVNNVGVSR